MQKQSNSQSGFFHTRLVLCLLLVLSSIYLVLVGFGAFSLSFAQTPNAPAPNNTPSARPHQYSPADANGRFVYLIEFSEPGLVHRPGSTMGQSFHPNTPQVQQQLTAMIEEQTQHVRG